MDDLDGSKRIRGVGNSAAQRRGGAKRLRVAGLVALVILTGLVAPVARDALAMRGNLEAGRRALLSAKAAVADMDVGQLQRALADARGPLERAASRARGLPLRALARVPLLGRSVRGAAALAQAGLLATEAGLEGVRAARVFPLRDGRLAYGTVGGRLDLSPWAKARAHLARTAELVGLAAARAERAPDTWVIGPVAQARRELAARLAELERFTAWTEEASHLVPSMLGASGPRRYLLVVQNLAEARATGGLIGGFALIEANRGRFRLTRVAANSELLEAAEPIPAPAWFRERYDIWGSRQKWQNVNMEADLRVTGPLIAWLFERTIGTRVDGVITTDPIGLAELLRVTGPIEGPHGITLEADSFAHLAMNEAYRIFAGPRVEGERKAFFVEAGALIWGRLLETADVRRAAEALGRAARGRHLMVWSSDGADEAALERVDLAGAFRDAGNAFVGVVTQTTTRSKVDYYLRRSPTLAVRLRPDGSAVFRLSLRLRNEAPSSGLPREVLGPDPGGPRHPPGQNRSWLNVYLPPGASVRSFTIAGVPALFASGATDAPTAFRSLQALPDALVVSGVVEVASRSSADVELTWEQAAVVTRSDGNRRFALTLLRQPTVAPDSVVVSVGVPGGLRTRAVSPGAAVEGDAVVWRATAEGEMQLEMELVSSPGNRALWPAAGAGGLVLAGLVFIARRRRGRPLEPPYGAPRKMDQLAASVSERGNGLRMWRRVRVTKGAG